MLRDHLSSRPFHPHVACDSGKFPPLKRPIFFSLLSAETTHFLTGSSAETTHFLFLKNLRKPAPGKGFQRPRARDKKLPTQEVISIQVVEASPPVENPAIFLCGGDPHTPLQAPLMGLDHSKASTPQERRKEVSERKRKDLYEVGEATPVLSSLVTRSRTLARLSWFRARAWRISAISCLSKDHTGVRREKLTGSRPTGYGLAQSFKEPFKVRHALAQLVDLAAQAVDLTAQAVDLRFQPRFPLSYFLSQLGHFLPKAAIAGQDQASQGHADRNYGNQKVGLIHGQRIAERSLK